MTAIPPEFVEINRSPWSNLKEVVSAAALNRDPVQVILAKNIAPGLSDEQWRSLLSGLRPLIATHFVEYCAEGEYFTITSKSHVEHLASGPPRERWQRRPEQP